MIGGIYGGVFTPTEAAGFSCAYTLLISMFVEHRIKLPDIPAIMLRSVRTSAIVTAIIAVSVRFGVLVA